MTAGEKALAVLLRSQPIGTVTEQGGVLEFRYLHAYDTSPLATPLSLSMPLSAKSHGDQAIRAFMWGLLPDNERVLERWARDYHVSPRNPFALLRHVGADCPGAVQFTPEDEVDRLRAGTGGVDWVDDDEIARRLRTLRGDPTAWHLSRTGQFSLAGAQAKTALYFDSREGRWGDPTGATPTTHIIKPAITGFDDHDLNEHLCLLAAGRLGLEAAVSRVAAFGDERAIVIERYDRFRRPDGTIDRIHQEDMCQALGVPPTAKYQNEGGPAPEDIMRLLRRHTVIAAQRDQLRFLDALAFNWLVAGTDAHAKNYSVLLNRSQVRLAPLYDIASVLPYEDMYVPKLKMAMRIGGEYRLARVGGRHWQRFSAAAGLDPELVVERVDRLAAAIADAFTDAANDPDVAALGSSMPRRLVDHVAKRADLCRAALATA